MKPLYTTAILALAISATSTAYAQDDAPPPPPPVESPDSATNDEPADTNDAAPERELKEFHLTDGQVIVGYGTDVGDMMEIELENGAEMTLPHTSIKYIIPRKGPVGPRTTHRTRYLYSPSGMMLKEGEGYISQKELIFTSVGYGITDNFSVIVGGAVPLWFINPQYTFNIIGGFKVGGEIADDVHLSAGAEALFVPGLSSFGGLAFGNITLGDEKGHATLNVAVPFLSQTGFTPEVITTTISGYHQFNDGFGLVTENWITFQPNSLSSTALLFNSLAGRFHAGDFTIDTGLILASTLSSSGLDVAPIPLPWVDFSWAFGP